MGNHSFTIHSATVEPFCCLRQPPFRPMPPLLLLLWCPTSLPAVTSALLHNHITTPLIPPPLPWLPANSKSKYRGRRPTSSSLVCLLPNSDSCLFPYCSLLCHLSLFAVPPTCQPHLYFRTFAYAVPSAQRVLPLESAWLIPSLSGFCLNVTFLGRPSWSCKCHLTFLSLLSPSCFPPNHTMDFLDRFLFLLDVSSSQKQYASTQKNAWHVVGPQ